MSVKILNTKELRATKPADIDKYIHELKVERVELLQGLQDGKVKTTHKLGQMKRSIAKALTVATEAKLSATKQTVKENK